MHTLPYSGFDFCSVLADNLLLLLSETKKTLSEDNLKRFLNGWKTACAGDSLLSSSVCDINILFDDVVSSIEDEAQESLRSLLGRAKAAVMTDITTSQEITCSRLLETLEKKTTHFKSVFPQKKL